MEIAAFVVAVLAVAISLCSLGFVWRRERRDRDRRNDERRPNVRAVWSQEHQRLRLTFDAHEDLAQCKIVAAKPVSPFPHEMSPRTTNIEGQLDIDRVTITSWRIGEPWETQWSYLSKVAS